MKYGITLFPTDYAIAPGELARAIEERGFDSFWVPEHSHFPVSPMTPGPDKPGLPKMYYDLADPFVALSMAAQATHTLKLGTSICLVVERDPIWLAKSVASLDALSGGRFLFGVGAGWNRPEMANHGTRWEERLELMHERLEAMKQIWTHDVAEFHGKHVAFGPMYAWPKPQQKPHPPILVAANAPRGLGRVVSQGDGWMPILAQDGSGVFEHLPALRERLAKAGKDPASFEITLYMCPQDRAVVERCRQAGIHRVVFLLQPEPRDAALRALDACVPLAR
jgi:probable F420-dependent oxidoreductase